MIRAFSGSSRIISTFSNSVYKQLSHGYQCVRIPQTNRVAVCVPVGEVSVCVHVLCVSFHWMMMRHLSIRCWNALHNPAEVYSNIGDWCFLCVDAFTQRYFQLKIQIKLLIELKSTVNKFREGVCLQSATFCFFWRYWNLFWLWQKCVIASGRDVRHSRIYGAQVR